jgi:molybdopterin-guanine dinucleotide biosynthesis protein B
MAYGLLDGGSMAVAPLVCFVGPSGVGKTTLIARVIARLSREGLRIGALKHDAHEFQMDREGKDTWRFRQAGAGAVGIASKTACATITWTGAPTSLASLAAAQPPDLDLILVEGWKGDQAPKIEVHRRGRPLLAATAGLANVIAVVTDDERVTTRTPRFHHDDVDSICELLRGFVRREICVA